MYILFFAGMLHFQWFEINLKSLTKFTNHKFQSYHLQSVSRKNIDFKKVTFCKSFGSESQVETQPKVYQLKITDVFHEKSYSFEIEMYSVGKSWPLLQNIEQLWIKKGRLLRLATSNGHKTG